MRIERILADKGWAVVTVAPSATVLEASRAMTRHRIGALVVSSDGRSIEGIVSERDIAAAVAGHGSEAGDLRVDGVMARDVHTCGPRSTADELMATMTERRVRHVPVVVDGRLSGIVSIGDVVKSRLDELEEENHTLHDYLVLGR